MPWKRFECTLNGIPTISFVARDLYRASGAYTTKEDMKIMKPEIGVMKFKNVSELDRCYCQRKRIKGCRRPATDPEKSTSKLSHHDGVHLDNQLLQPVSEASKSY